MANMTQRYTAGFENITDPTQFVLQLNTNMDYLLGTTTMFTVWLILTIVLLNNGYPLKQSFEASSYVALILAWLFWILNMIGPTWLYFFLIMAGVGIVSMYFRQD